VKNPVPDAVLSVIHPGQTRLSAAELAAVEAFIVQPASPWFSEVERILITRALAGEFVSAADDYFFLLSAGGRYISHAWYCVNRNAPEVGVLGYVWTDSEWRGRGLSRYLCGILLDHFDAGGGKAIYLGTSNPVARRLYLENRFNAYHGRVMRRLAQDLDEERFEERTFTPSQDLSLRSAEWSDVAPGTALYTHVTPWITRDFSEGVVLPPGGELTRCISIFAALMVRSEIPGNSMQVLQNGSKSIVGCFSLVALPKAEETVLEFMVHPHFSEAAAPLLRRRLGSEARCVSYAAGPDTAKLALLQALDFRGTPDQAVRNGVSLTRFQYSNPTR